MLAPPRGLSQRATSFIASQCQGIHQMPLALDLEALRREQTSRPPIARGSKPSTWNDPALTMNGLAVTTVPSTSSLRPKARKSMTLQPVASDPRCQRTIQPAQTITATVDQMASMPHDLPSKQVLSRITHAPSCNTPGGADRDRTGDPLLAKQVLSQLSYNACRQRDWWAREDLNFRPHAYQARALTS